MATSSNFFEPAAPIARALHEAASAYHGNLDDDHLKELYKCAQTRWNGYENALKTGNPEGRFARSDLEVPRKSERIVELLAAQPDHGVAAAVACLCATDDESVAAFFADYLSIIPGAAPDKTRAAERLRGAGSLALAAAGLVPWLPTPLINGFITDYLQQPVPESPLFSVIFEIAMWRPERLRPHAERIDHPSLRRGMLSGAPDTWVTDLVDRWHDEHDPDVLDTIARIRTPAAAEALVALRAEVDDRDRWEILVEMAGRLPDGRARSSYAPAFVGFVVERERTTHVMGGAFPGDVPICMVCEAPAERVLTLDADRCRSG